MALAARLVEVIADREAAAARYRYGSGCIVQGRTVLTAAHVVAGAVSVQVHDRNKTHPRPPWIPAVGMPTVRGGPGAGGDRRPGHRPAPIGRGSIGRSDGRAGGMPCSRLPVVRRDPVAGGGARHRGCDRGSPGVVEAGGRAVERAVSMAPRPLPPEDRSLAESEWSGCPAPRWWRPISCLGW